MLERLLASQREMLLIAVTMTALILIFSGGRSGLSDTLLITAIYSFIVGNLVRVVVRAAAVRLGWLNAPWSYLALVLVFALTGVIGGGVATAALLGVSEAFGLYDLANVRNIGRNAIELSVLVSVLAGVMSTASAARRAELEATIVGQREELERARDIQRQLLPETLPLLAGYEVAGHWQPARAVGGDYYDLWRIDDDHVGVCIADVSGKGLAAALLMANLQAAVRVIAISAFSPADLCVRLNAALRRNLGRGRFVTLFVGILELPSGTLVFANAGHNPPLVRRGNGRLDLLGATGPGIGLLAAATYSEAEVTLDGGDRLLLFTDGLPEAGIDLGAPLEEARIGHALATAASPDALVAELSRAVLDVSGGPDLLHDDVTMLALYRTR